MVIQFTLQELMLFLICALGIAAGVLLLHSLWNLKKLVSILRALAESNQEYIKHSIRTMPGILDNLGEISSNIRDTTNSLKISVPLILQEVECVTHAVKGSFELTNVVMENIGSGINETVAAYRKETSGFTNYFHILEEVIQIIYRIFLPGK